MKPRTCSVCKESTGSLASKCKKHAAEYQRERAYQLRKAIREYKVTKGCADCGYNAHHAGLEFDHPNDNKKANVAKLAMQGNVSAAWTEISKCEVVCGTCHSIRTWNRSHEQ